MEDLVKKLPFIINPNLRLHSPNFKIGWHVIDFNILQTEASFVSAEDRLCVITGNVKSLLNTIRDNWI